MWLAQKRVPASPALHAPIIHHSPLCTNHPVQLITPNCSRVVRVAVICGYWGHKKTPQKLPCLATPKFCRPSRWSEQEAPPYRSLANVFPYFFLYHAIFRDIFIPYFRTEIKNVYFSTLLCLLWNWRLRLKLHLRTFERNFLLLQ